MYLSDSTHDLVGSNESRAAFCHAQRVNHCYQIDIDLVIYPCYENRENQITAFRRSGQTPGIALTAAHVPTLGSR